jgi:hypothetical protein
MHNGRFQNVPPPTRLVCLQPVSKPLFVDAARGWEDTMTLNEALNASPPHVAINTTGSERAMVRRYTNGGLQAFKPKSPGPGWTHAPIDHAVAVGVDASAWEAVQSQAQINIF